MSKRLPKNSVSPCVVTFDANHDTSEPVALRWPPAAVTGVSINVRRPDGATSVWAATVTEVRSDGITARHALASGDVDIAGRYDCELVLTFASGTLKSFIDTIQVIDTIT